MGKSVVKEGGVIGGELGKWGFGWLAGGRGWI